MSEIDEVAEAIYNKYKHLFPMNIIQLGVLVVSETPGETRTIREEIVRSLHKIQGANK